MNIEELLSLSSSINRGFAHLFTRKQKLVIYGAGNIGTQVYEILKKEGYSQNIIAFLDVDEKKKQFDGIPVLRPKESGCLEPHILVVALSLPMAEYPAFYQAQKKENTISIVNGYHIFLEDMFWKDPREMVCSDDRIKEKIRFAYAALKDDESRRVFCQSLRCHLMNRYESALWNTKLEQYIIPEWDDTNKLDGVVDCGAYIGDTLESLLKYKEIKSYYGFEPDLSNFKRLAEKAGNCENLGQAILFPNAVGDRNALLQFENGAGASSALSNTGKSYVVSTTLDSVLKKADISFIKMDIEGAELDALYGAVEIIKNQKPNMAICVYHKMEHLWEIPAFIKQLVPEYSFYLRCHYGFTLETVLYAEINR